MKRIAMLLSIVSIPLLIFGYAGCFSDWGQKHYDEMNGMYPFFALVIGCFLLFISLVLLIIHWAKK
jgi:hypothetical protein